MRLIVRVGEGEGSLGDHEIGNLLIGPFGVVLDHIGQQLELIHQMGILGRVNLGKLQLQLRQPMMHALQNGRRNLGGVVMNEVCDLGHAPSLAGQAAESSSAAGAQTVCISI